jgi:hypothetical protein
LNKNEIEILVDDLLKEIKKCIKYNQPYSAATQNFAERVCTELFNIILDPKKGYSFDTNLNDEIKTCEYLQPKTCNNCEKILNFFSDICYCGSTDFKNESGDSRWSINSASHFKHFKELNRYILFLVECKDKKTMTFSMKGWIIDKNNSHFNYILKNQSEAKTKSLNFLPFSHDFFLSDPLLFLDMDFNDNGIIYNFCDVEASIPYLLKREHFNYNSSILNTEELELILNIKDSKKVLLDSLFYKFGNSIKLSDLKLDKRKKALGKLRGITKR